LDCYVELHRRSSFPFVDNTHTTLHTCRRPSTCVTSIVSSPFLSSHVPFYLLDIPSRTVTEAVRDSRSLYALISQHLLDNVIGPDIDRSLSLREIRTSKSFCSTHWRFLLSPFSAQSHRPRCCTVSPDASMSSNHTTP
jgi:hypothetical protein